MIFIGIIDTRGKTHYVLAEDVAGLRETKIEGVTEVRVRDAQAIYTHEPATKLLERVLAYDSRPPSREYYEAAPDTPPTDRKPDPWEDNRYPAGWSHVAHGETKTTHNRGGNDRNHGGDDIPF